MELRLQHKVSYNVIHLKRETRQKHETFIFRKNSTEFASPPGYNLQAGQTHSEVTKDTDQSQLIIKKSWDVALGPIKGVRKFSTTFIDWISSTSDSFLYFLDSNEFVYHVYGW